MTSRLAGRPILIVEDEPLIALDVADAINTAGGQATLAFSRQQGLALVRAEPWSAAVLDYTLPDGDCSPISDWLIENRIPFIVYTGYEKVGGSCASGLLVPKPIDASAIVTEVEQLIGPHTYERG
jgi:DNA-binding response OmpR family regulator